MITRGNFKTATASLRAAKWRSFLTMLGIIVGISSVVTIVSLGEGLKHQIVGQIDKLGADTVTVRSGRIKDPNSVSSLGILSLSGVTTLTDKDVTALKKLPAASKVVPLNYVTDSISVDGSESNNIPVIGTSESFPEVMSEKVIYGTFFADETESKNFAVIGTGVAHDQFGQLNPVGKSLTIEGRSFIVRGVLEKVSGSIFSVAQIDFNSAVFIPQNTAKDLVGGNTNILQILLKPAAGTKPDKLVADASAELNSSHGHQDFSVLKQSQLQQVANQMINKMTGFISGIAAISLLVGGVGIMDIMLVSISERTREIGIRKAVGATNKQILAQFMVEGLILSLTGGIIGIFMSLAINGMLKIYTHLDPVISPLLLFGAATTSVVIGIIFSSTPALKAARKDPIEALRS